MPRGDKSSYTDKQKRQAEHIEEGYERRGVPEREAERRAWATVNKEEERLRSRQEGRPLAIAQGWPAWWPSGGPATGCRTVSIGQKGRADSQAPDSISRTA
jgi:hypothetical protein